MPKRRKIPREERARLCFCRVRDAITSGRQLSAIETLLADEDDDDASVVFEMTEHGSRTLLRIACSWVEPVQVEVLCFLIRKSPVAVFQTADGHGETPLHQLCSNLNDSGAWNQNALVHVTRLMLQRYPGAAKITDENLDTPLHAACFSKNLPLEVVKLLSATYPAAMGKSNKYGNTPLHLFCTEPVDLAVVRFVARSYPVACLIRSRIGLSHIALERLEGMDYDCGARSYVDGMTQSAAKALIELASMVAPAGSNASTSTSTTNMLTNVIAHIQNSVPRASKGGKITTANNWDLSREELHKLIDNDDLQELLRESGPYQLLLNSLVRMNLAGRRRRSFVASSCREHTDYGKQAGALLVLLAVQDNQEGIFIHLRENPNLVGNVVRATKKE